MVVPTPCRSRLSFVPSASARRSGSRSRCLRLSSGRELVLAGCSLDQPEHQIALLERSWPDLLTVVAAQTLLVDGRPAEG